MPPKDLQPHLDVVQSIQETDEGAAIALEVKNRLRQRWIAELNKGNPEPLKHITPVLTDDDLIPVLMNFIAAFPAFSRKLFTMHGTIDDLGSGIGRGEVLIYFIFDDVTLGGTTSSIDIHVTGIPNGATVAKVGEAFKQVVPNSGTAERSAIHNMIFGNPLTGLPAVGGANLMQRMMFSPLGQRYLTQGLLPVNPNLAPAGALLGGPMVGQYQR